jgi:hypothetical protein
MMTWIIRFLHDDINVRMMLPSQNFYDLFFMLS